MFFTFQYLCEEFLWRRPNFEKDRGLDMSGPDVFHCKLTDFVHCATVRLRIKKLGLVHCTSLRTPQASYSCMGWDTSKHTLLWQCCQATYLHNPDFLSCDSTDQLLGRSLIGTLHCMLPSSLSLAPFLPLTSSLLPPPSSHACAIAPTSHSCTTTTIAYTLSVEQPT